MSIKYPIMILLFQEAISHLNVSTINKAIILTFTSETIDYLARESMFKAKLSGQSGIRIR